MLFNNWNVDLERAEIDEFGVALSDSNGVAISGDSGISVVGPGGVAKSGVDGILIFIDDSQGYRTVSVAYVGVNGIQPDQFYEFDGEQIVISNFGG